MEINFEYCNNIDNGKIHIKNNNLNIKYAINGTGKSTISKSMHAFVNDRITGSKTLLELKPFKFKNDESINPIVRGIDGINSIKIFDEKYINEFVFQSDELLKGSFDIFIKDEAYENGMQEIDSRIKKIKAMLADDPDIASLILDLNELSSSFGQSTKTGIHGSSSVAQALKNGNKVANIPEGLKSYKAYIQHSENYKWMKWQIDGKSYLDISTDCPYCTNDIGTKREGIELIGSTYKAKNVENLTKIVAVFERLDRYFSDETKVTIRKIITDVDGYSDDQEKFLRQVKEQIEDLNKKFQKAQRLGFQSFKDVEKAIECLKEHKIDMDFYVYLKSESTVEKVRIINDAIDEVINEAGELHGSIVRQKRLIEQLVRDNSVGINNFLKNAGYNYHVSLIENNTGEHKLKLIHNDFSEEITNAKNHLSFGEKNAFALILFMHDVLKTPPDLIVLDDPISSFDKNKKYAIIEMLFRKDKSLKNKTVLLLTHDFEPIVDMLLHHNDRFAKPYTSFLENKHGQLSETEIVRDDIKNFVEINKINFKSDIHDLNKLVYLRRTFEILGNKNSGWDVLSNLFHKVDQPTKREKLEADEIRIRVMTQEELEEGFAEIKTEVPTFDYQLLLNLVKNDLHMKDIYLRTSSNYEKLHLYRLISDDKINSGIESDVILKFINEAFHIENNYIYHVNPSKYQTIPQFVIDECDKYVTNLGSSVPS
ncbi:MAG: hypothetical protein CTY33_05215 [Methylotenera sp.]|nr:MAG: hypothetical protein CTY33_05215 [Methylotenera sp.]